MQTIDALPNAEQAGASDQQTAEQLADLEVKDAPEGEQGQGEQPSEKKEKTPEERELARARRKIDRLTKQKYELLAQVSQPRTIQRDSSAEESDQDADSVTLSRAEIAQMVREQAEKLAPTLQTQRATEEHRRTVIQALEQKFGPEKFDEIAADLDDALGGLKDAQGRMTPATEAIFEADDPAALVEFLADPENAAVAQKLASASPVRAGREIARIEALIAAEKAKSKPQRSSVPAPVEGVRGQGATNQSVPTETKAYMKWANEKYGAV